jgi:hypothetical protein
MLRFDYLKSCILAATVAFLRQFSGYFAVSYFTLSIFQAAGGSIGPNMSTVLVGAVVLVFSLLATFTVDKIGRKSLAVWASAVMTLMLTIFGVYFLIKDVVASKNIGWVPLFALMIYVAAFNWGISNIVYIILGELVPIQVWGFLQYNFVGVP